MVSTKRQLDLAVAARNREQTAAAATGAPAPATAVRRARRAVARRAVVVPPEIQAQWADLQRADEVLHVNYQQLVARREAAGCHRPPMRRRRQQVPGHAGSNCADRAERGPIARSM